MSTLGAVEIASGSMRPSLPSGSVALVDEARPRLGETALIRGAQGLLAHRVLFRIGRWIIHAGDASPQVGLASVRDMLGRVQAPALSRPPAYRRARCLGLLLQIATPFDHLGFGAAAPFRWIFRVAERLTPRLLQDAFGIGRTPPDPGRSRADN